MPATPAPSIPSSARPDDPAFQHAAAPHALTAPQRIYLWLAATSAACLIVANVIGVKLFQFVLPFAHVDAAGERVPYTITHTAGMLTFPITFLITDLVNDYYGRRAARRIVYLSFAMAFIAFAAFRVAEALPHWNVDFNIRPEAFSAVLSSAATMYVASLVAYVVGSLSDIFFFGIIKRLTGGKLIWLRATGSTIISQMIDSLIVTYIAFSLTRALFPTEGGPTPMPLDDVLSTAATGYVLKFFIALAVTPLIYLGSYILRSRFGMTPLPPNARG